MEKYIANLVTLAEQCDCGNHHNPITIEKISVGKEVLLELVSFLKSKGYKKPILIADVHTFEAAGVSISKDLTQSNISFSVSLIKPDENNDVVADEKSLVQALLEMPQDTDVIIAVGAGTIHDIARFCSAKTAVPFISVPTAPSVDGFTSMGAPLIVRGVKITYQMTAPIALFVDIGILKDAPKKMIAAGFGDMLAKFTSLADWKFDHLVKEEPYCPLVAEITREALDACMEQVDSIADGDERGVRILIEALIKSGLAMLIFGQSHPASGGEHHLSHYWEMEFLRQKRPAILHGAKVGVSTSLLAGIYKEKFLPFILDSSRLHSFEDKAIVAKISENLTEINHVYQQIPESGQLRRLLEKLSGETIPAQLGIDDELVKASLSEAHNLRKRYTGLKFLNEINVQSTLLK
ncbi:sn-glycerol-1-phosphate dehydrogenase [Litchfieldia alkalitelluris]|uniref:sn-glycerol-1-phosphate dehydrogenase n=1 Tax=Litchfieldia alkalitelluris TaxID=304268 RepID=UPI000997586F|nr:sn-glycerol-1-phosphate dehydrogenase [Litchfieldia alkalitelluris]